MIDPLAKVHISVYVPPTTYVWAFASVHAGVILGEHVSIGEHVYIGIGTHIGDHTRISQGAHITDHMTIGERVFISPHVVFCNDRHPTVNNPSFKRDSPCVDNDVSIGTNTTILPGVILGRGCIVGAGAVVTKNVEPYTTVYGNPAKEARRAV